MLVLPDGYVAETRVRQPERESCRNQMLLALILPVAQWDQCWGWGAGRYVTHGSVSLCGGSVTLGEAKQDKSLQ